MGETWLYHYDHEQSNNQWSGGIAAYPTSNNPSSKIHWKSSRLDFVGSRRQPPHWSSSKGPNYQRGVLLISVGATEGHFEERTPREGHQKLLFLHENAPAHRALTTQKKLAYLGFQLLDQPPSSPDLAPLDYHLFPGLKKQLKGRHFSSFLPRRPGWTDKLLIFLSGLQKFEQRAKNYIEFRVEYGE